MRLIQKKWLYSVLEKSYDYLLASKELCDYHYFISIPLKSFSISVDLKEVIQDSINTASDFLAESLGLQKSVMEGWELKYEKQRAELEKKFVIARLSPAVNSGDNFC